MDPVIETPGEPKEAVRMTESGALEEEPHVTPVAGDDSHTCDGSDPRASSATDATAHKQVTGATESVYRAMAGRALLSLTNLRTLASTALLLLASTFVTMPTGVREVILGVAAAVACLMPLAAARRAGRIDLVELGVAVGIAYLVLFPLRAFVVLNGFDGAANAGVLEADAITYQKVLIFVTLGFVAGSVGYLIPLGARLGRNVRVPAVTAIENPSASVAVGVFAIGLAAEALALAAYRLPDQLGFLAGRASGLVSGSTALLLVGLCLLTRRAVVACTSARCGLLATAVAVTVALALVGQFKEVGVIALLAPLVMWHLCKPRGLRGRWFAIASIAIVFLIFPLVNLWRAASLRVERTSPVHVAPAVLDQALHYDWVTGGPHQLRLVDVITEPLAVTSHRLYGYDTMTLAVRYTPSEIPYQDGATLQNLASGIVPRILWPGKPRIGIGYWFAVNYWGTPPGVLRVPQAVTHPGELYIDFGVVGVVIGLALLGVWYRFAWEALRPRESATAALLYTVLFMTVIVVDRDLPLVYVTLIQRLAVTGLLMLTLALVSQAIGRHAPRSAPKP